MSKVFTFLNALEDQQAQEVVKAGKLLSWLMSLAA
jgi:hypothetical protein